MSDGYKVSIELALQDKFTDELSRTIKALSDANKALEEFTPDFKKYTDCGKELAQHLDHAADAQKRLAEGKGLAVVVTRVAALAQSSVEFARNFREAAAACDKISRVSHGRGMAMYSSSRYMKFSAESKGEAGAAKGAAEEASFADGAADAAAERGGPEGMALGVALKALDGVVDAGKEGFKANLDLDDYNRDIFHDMHGNPDHAVADTASLKKFELDSADRLGSAINGEVDQVARALAGIGRVIDARSVSALETEYKLHAGIAAGISRRSGESFDDVAVNLAEANDTVGYEKGYEKVAFDFAYGKALDALHIKSEEMNDALNDVSNIGSLGLQNLGDNLYALGMLKRDGMLEGMGGDTLNDLISKKLPQTLSNATQKDRKAGDAGRELGLYDGNRANFFKNGDIDLMELFKRITKAELTLGHEKTAADLKNIFGENSELGDLLAQMLNKVSIGKLKGLAGMNQDKLNQNYLVNEAAVETAHDAEKRLQTNVNVIGANATETSSDKYGQLVKKAADVTQNKGVAAKRIADDAIDGVTYPYTVMARSSLVKELKDVWHWVDSTLLKKSAAPDSNGSAGAARHASAGAPLDVRDPRMQAAYANTGQKNVSAGGLSGQANAVGVEPVERQGFYSRMEKALELLSGRMETNVVTNVYLDGKVIPNYLFSSTTMGSSGINPASMRLGPGMSNIGFAGQ